MAEVDERRVAGEGKEGEIIAAEEDGILIKYIML